METGDSNVTARRDLVNSRPRAGRQRTKAGDEAEDRPVKVDVKEVAQPGGGDEGEPTQAITDDATVDSTHEEHEPLRPGGQPGSRHHYGRCECGCGSETSCGAIVLERNRYFYSKVMTARDFTGEQDYSVSRHRLHNRLLHGWGIVCGLEVEKHPKPECQNTRVMVQSGIAIDCCGREIVLDKDMAFDISNEADAHARHGADRPNSPAVLCVRYHEERIEYVPVLYSEEGCDPGRREANRLRESAHLELVDWSDLPAGCWSTPSGSAEECEDCDEGARGGSCLEPTCACGELVPLAVLTWEEGTDRQIKIDSSGRRDLLTGGDRLTRIASINWEHGGEITLDELAEDLKGRLEVRFNRHIQAAVGEATGINSRTFVVQYVNIQRDLEFLPSQDESGDDEEGSPRLAHDDPCLAVFDIDRHYLNHRSGLAGSTVFVTLKCDFILDCDGNAVDGNHLKGILPSGDGVPGGVFESWFRVVADRGGQKEAAR